MSPREAAKLVLLWMALMSAFVSMQWMARGQSTVDPVSLALKLRGIHRMEHRL